MNIFNDDFLTRIGPFDFSKQPPGLVGEIASFIFSAAPHPVHEIAVTGALAFMAAICGRAYNTPTNAGLNLYLLLAAPTGTGKEAMKRGMEQLLFYVGRNLCSKLLAVPAITRFIGPGHIASGPALMRHLSEVSSCCLSVLGEFGHLLSKLCHPKASSNDVGLLGVLCDLYGESGKGDVLSGMAYADKRNNTVSIASPAFSILAEGTPETIFETLNEAMITNGFLARFIVVEYKGKRVPKNKDHANSVPSKELIDKIAKLAAYALERNQKQAPIKIALNDRASIILEQFDEFCTNKINSLDREKLRDLWNRAHLNALKIASLLAIGDNPYMPTISLDNALWAIQLVTQSVTHLIDKFESGEVGSDNRELAQEDAVMQAMEEFAISDFYTIIRKYGNCTDPIQHERKTVRITYLSRKLCKKSMFKHDARNRTPSEVLNATVKRLIDKGRLCEVSFEQKKTNFNGFRGRLIAFTETEFEEVKAKYPKLQPTRDEVAGWLANFKRPQ